jgi:hypothetical protein
MRSGSTMLTQVAGTWQPVLASVRRTPQCPQLGDVGPARPM